MTGEVRERPWVAQRGAADYVLTADRTAIARFATADEARDAGGRPVLTGCVHCGVHADEFHPCNCGAMQPGGPATHVRHTHPFGFRAGEWAEILGVAMAHGQLCWHVRFEDDGAEDLWVIVDELEPYEFRREVPA
jgi:hypothetical protein